METCSYTIRAATVADAPALAALAERTFRDTFSSANTPDDMDEYCRRNYGESIQAAEIRSKSVITLVAESDGNLVGYAQLRPNASAPSCVSGSGPGEIQRLYVEGAFHGKGIAQALMRSSASALRERGCDVAWLGVWEHNARAISFYRKAGCVAAGEHVFELGSDPQRDVVMVLPLLASGAVT